MGRKGKQQQKLINEITKTRSELPMNHGDFPSKESWDQFFTITGCDFFSESYADWPQLQNLLTNHLLSVPSSSSLSPLPESAGAPSSVSILVPACGNSRLSEHLYDSRFTNITNVDFSKVVISHMLKRNVRERPLMKWRVMDMTAMEFANETLDAVVDKGGLDCLMDPKLGPRLGSLYLSEVKRLLKAGGKYICVTFAELNVLVLFFPKFRFGWKLNLYAIAHEQSSGDIGQQAFMVVAEKLVSTVVSQISLFLNEYSAQRHANNKADEFYDALEREKEIRAGCSNASHVFIPLEDLILGAKADFTELEPGRRLKLTLGEFAASRFFYECILIDAPRDSGPFSHHFIVYVVPNTPTLEWIISISEGQWVIVKTFKSARVLMVILDFRHSNVDKKDILSDLAPLVNQLAPGCDDGVEIPFTVANDGIKYREIVYQVTSALTGPIVVDDVIYEELGRRFPEKILIRRFSIQSFMQSEALLSREGSNELSSEVEKSKVQAMSKTRKKGKQGKLHSRPCGSHVSSGAMKVQHNYLASPHHNAIISGLMLISVHLRRSTSVEGLMKTMVIGLVPLSEVKTVVIGLRAGLLPMFMNNCLPYLKIEVVELDPLILDVAREYFDFKEDGRLKVHITDGIKFVREKANSDSDGKGSSNVDVLIVDVESPESRSCQGVTSPPADFIEESFLLTIKNSLSEQGLFIINLISWSSAVKGSVYSRLKMVFSNVFSLQLVEDINEVIFALNTESPVNEDELCEACNALARSLAKERQEWGKKVIDAAKLIKPLR